MYPNLQNNERVLMLHKAKIKRDSVVVFDAYGVDQNNTGLTKDTKYVKRVIALPGDTVEYRDDGQLFVNGKFRSQGYITSQQQADGTLKVAANLPKAKGVVLGTGSTFKVPRGKYFVLGADTLLYTSEAPRTPKTVVRPPEPRFPTPAMMPQRRAGDGPTTFASLDAQELPVVREYSAGGLVFDERGRVAIIARHSRNGHLEWCLPKGHIEKGETPQQTAVREVHEETGILGEVVESIATIDYWFTGTSQRVHKLVHHFALRQIGGDLTVEGDPDHEAEDAIWVDFDDLDDVLSYPNERKIAWLYARKMKQG